MKVYILGVQHGNVDNKNRRQAEEYGRVTEFNTFVSFFVSDVLGHARGKLVSTLPNHTWPYILFS